MLEGGSGDARMGMGVQNKGRRCAPWNEMLLSGEEVGGKAVKGANLAGRRRRCSGVGVEVWVEDRHNERVSIGTRGDERAMGRKRGEDGARR